MSDFLITLQEFFFNICFYFIYLPVLGLSGSTRDFRSSKLPHVGSVLLCARASLQFLRSSSLTRDQTQVPGLGNLES